MNETETLTIRVPKGWKKILEDIDREHGAIMRPQYARVARQAIMDQHPTRFKK